MESCTCVLRVLRVLHQQDRFVSFCNCQALASIGKHWQALEINIRLRNDKNQSVIGPRSGPKCATQILRVRTGLSGGVEGRGPGGVRWIEFALRKAGWQRCGSGVASVWHRPPHRCDSGKRRLSVISFAIRLSDYPKSDTIIPIPILSPYILDRQTSYRNAICLIFKNVF